MKKCPYCSKYLMNARAVICIHCGRNVVTGEAIPTAMPSEKSSDSLPPKISSSPPASKTPPDTLPPKVSSDAKTSPRSYGKKAFYAAKLTGAIALMIFAGVCLFDTYKNYKAQETASAVSPEMTGSANAENPGTAVATKNIRSAPQPEASAGKTAETEEKNDEAAAETMLKAIAECNCDFHPYALRAGTREFRVSISGYIRFKPDQEQPVRMKIYRAATNDGKYSLIYNDILKNFQRPETRTLQTPVRTQEIRMINGVQTTVTRITGTGNPMGASLNFNIADATALDCGSNNVFYKIKLCSESGLPLTESNPLRVPLVPRPVVADDLKTWTWTPLFPGQDPLLGVLQNGQTAIPVSNAPVEGQLAGALSKQNRFNPPVYFKSAAPPLSGCWRYSRSGQNQMSRFAPDAIEIKPVFSKNRLFEIKGQVELRSLKIDGRKVSLQADSNISTQTIRKVTLNYPGTPVAELEFAYGGKTNTLRVQLPPVPTGLRAQLLDDGSVKLTWDPLAGRIDPGQFTGPPDIKLLRDQKVIHTCDINQTEFIDKQTAPDRIYAYSMALDDANIKAQVWTKEKGLTETRVLLENLENPYPESSKAIVYTYPQKPAARPVRISFWEPALCYERTGGPGMRLFSAAVRKLGQEADFELLDRTSRNHVVEEKVLTMSYEKSILIKTLSADFTVLVRDYSRQQGNGAELWLIQNKAFDYKDVIRSGTWILPSNADDKFLAWRIGSISAEELKMPEKAAELGDKLAAEIRRRVFFKSAASPKEASVPVKFIFRAYLLIKSFKPDILNKFD